MQPKNSLTLHPKLNLGKNVITSSQTLQAGHFHNINFIKPIFYAGPALQLEKGINYLNEAPTTDGKTYTYKGDKFVRPEFRLARKRQPGSKQKIDVFQFEKGEDDKLYLKFSLEAYAPTRGALPLELDNDRIEITFQYQTRSGEWNTIPTSIEATPLRKEARILRDYHCSCEIPQTQAEKEEIRDALIYGAAKLEIEARIPWEKPPVDPNAPDENCEQFDPEQLTVKGRYLYLGQRRFLRLKNQNDAQKALQIIQHYQMDSKCSVKGDEFMYFLSQGEAPKGKKLPGEDCIPFNPDKIEVKKIGGRWKIVEGNHWMFDFDQDEKTTRKVYDIIKYYGFAQSCYVGRPHPPMSYMKAKEPVQKITVSPFVLNPITIGAIKPIGGISAGSGAANSSNSLTLNTTKPTLQATEVQALTNSPSSKTKYVSLTREIELQYPETAEYVYQGLLDTEVKVLAWLSIELERSDYISKNIAAEAIESFTLHYCPTETNTVYHLPQEYRLDFIEKDGVPDLQITLYREEKDGESETRLTVSMEVVPYTTPVAKRKLQQYLDEKVSEETIYIKNLDVGGFEKASFEYTSGFSDRTVDLGSKPPENKEEGIDPVRGFTLDLDMSLESFTSLKNNITNYGLHIGDVIFAVIEGTEENGVITRSETQKEIRVPVNIDLKCLAPIALNLENVSNQVSGDQTSTGNFFIRNTYDYPVKIQGIDLLFLSGDESLTRVYDIDYEVNLQEINSWPFRIPNGIPEGYNKILSITGLDQPEKNQVWTHLIAEIVDASADYDPETIMQNMIDLSKVKDVWELTVECVTYANWDDLPEEEKTKMEEIDEVEVRIYGEAGTGNSQLCTLTKNESRANITMSNSLRQILDAQDVKERIYVYQYSYVYRDGTRSLPSGMIESQPTASAYLPIHIEIEN